MFLILLLEANESTAALVIAYPGRRQFGAAAAEPESRRLTAPEKAAAACSTPSGCRPVRVTVPPAAQGCQTSRSQDETHYQSPRPKGSGIGCRYRHL